MPETGKMNEDVPSKEDLSGSNYVILDANALISPFQQNFNLDIELDNASPGIRPVVPTSVIRELESLNKKGDWRVKAALDLARKYPSVDIRGKGDAPIFNLAIKKGWSVMTQDRRLRMKLLRNGIPVIILRGKAHLQVMEP
jgi:rRNA-processing protein FCF1